MIHYPNPIESGMHSLEDGMNISKGGMLDQSSHRPTHKDGNAVDMLHYRPTGSRVDE